MLVRLYGIAGVLERILSVLHPDFPSPLFTCSMCQPLVSLCWASTCLSLGPPSKTASGLFAKTVKHVLMTPTWGVWNPNPLALRQNKGWGSIYAPKLLTASGRNWDFVWSLLEFGFFCCFPLLPFLPNCFLQGVVVQSLSQVWLFATPWTAASKASLSFTISWSLLKLMSIESVMPSNHLSSVVPCSSCLQSFPASESFPMNRLSASDGQSIRAWASASA